MEIAGVHLAIGPLLSGCFQIVTTINKLHQSYKFMPMTLASIVATCNMTRITLDRVDSNLVMSLDITKKVNRELLEQFDGIKIGCTMTLSLLEKHVTDLLEVGSSAVPLKAQQTSRKHKLKSLYNESDMKELLGQMKDHNALLNTILNVLQSEKQKSSMDKQDEMMFMMVNQEQTLQNLFRARKSFHRYLMDADILPDNDVATLSTSTTAGSTLTKFGFDSIIMRTAVYKRCVKRSDLGNELLVALETLAEDTASTSELNTGNDGAESRFIPEPQQRQKITPASFQTKGSPVGSSPSVRAPSPEAVTHLHRTTLTATSAHLPRSSSTMVSNHSGESASPKGDIQLTQTRESDHVQQMHTPLGNTFPSPGHQESQARRRAEIRPVLCDYKESVIVLALSSKHILAVALRSSIRLWDISTDREVAHIPCRVHSSMAFSPDGKILASCHDYRYKGIFNIHINLWDARTGTKMSSGEIALDPGVGAFTFSKDGRTLACFQPSTIYGREKDTIAIYSTATGLKVRTFQVNGSEPLMSIHDRRRYLFSCRGDEELEVWNIRMGTVTTSKFLGRGVINIVNSTYNSSDVVISGSTCLYPIPSGPQTAKITLSSPILHLADSPETECIFFARRGGFLGIWTPSSGKVKEYDTGLKKEDLDVVTFSPDASIVCFAAPDGKVMRKWLG